MTKTYFTGYWYASLDDDYDVTEETVERQIKRMKKYTLNFLLYIKIIPFSEHVPPSKN